MMLMTTSSSISVKPRRWNLPIMVWHAVDPFAGGERIDVEDVVAGLRRIRGALVAAKPPAIGRSGRAIREKRIARNSPQKINHDVIVAAHILDTIHQQLQRSRVAAGVHQLQNAPLVGGL